MAQVGFPRPHREQRRRGSVTPVEPAVFFTISKRCGEPTEAMYKCSKCGGNLEKLGFKPQIDGYWLGFSHVISYAKFFSVHALHSEEIHSWCKVIG